MASAVEQIKSRLNITEVVGSYIKLEKAGANLRACCPFHNEKTPSFYVSPERGSYHCFGCNKGGDLISFVEEIEGVDFIEALRILAVKAGIELKDYDRSGSDKSKRLYKLLAEATHIYAKKLAETPAALEYLTKRGLSVETIKTWQLGLAPEGWTFIYDNLKKLGYRDEEMEQVGLISRVSAGASRGRSFYDRFRGRIMFPLADQGGRVVGYSGRIFESSEAKSSGTSAESVSAKYVNTPATLLYDKSSILYGYDRAKVEIRRRDMAVLVEGQMDLLLSHQAGVTNTVAVSGTALTEKHLSLIKRSTNNLIVAFDGDSAGIKAARRALGLSLMLGMEVKVAELPKGLDPADLVLRDQGAWVEAVAKARPVIDFFLSVVTGRELPARELNQGVIREVLPLIRMLTSPIDQAHYLAKVASALGVQEEVVREEFNKLKTEELLTSTRSLEVPKPPARPPETRDNRLLRRFVGLLWWQETKESPEFSVAAIQEKIKESLPIGRWTELCNGLAGDRERLILEAEMAYDGMVGLAVEAEELGRNFQVDVLKTELSDLTGQIRTLELAGKMDDLEKALRRCQEITKIINDIKS